MIQTSSPAEGALRRKRRSLLILLCFALTIAVAAPAADQPPTTGAPGQAVAGPAALVHPDSLPSDDPFPIRRLRATEAQLPDVRKQLEAGPLVQLPRSEFEARVRAAARATAEAKNLPRIANAHFKASLGATGELVGTAELELASTGTTSHFLPLDPLRIAIGSATWGDGREAVIGFPTGGLTAGVWVDKPGRQTLKFTWSLAGITEPGERQFELRVPAAPTAMLELDLPTGQVPTVPAGEVLLTGPFPLPGNPQRALWRFRFGGRSWLEFAVRPAGNPGVAASASLSATYDITPGQLACGFEYDLRPAKGTVGEWEFGIDPGLRVTDVVVNNRAGWTVDSSAGVGMPRNLRVTLRQPGAGGKVLVSAVAPFPDATRPADAPLPMVRPLDANLDKEKIDIHLAPGMKLENWNPGDYRVKDSQSLPDQLRTISLEGTMLPPGIDRLFRRAPSLHTSVSEAEFTTIEQTVWRFDADRITATVRVEVRVRRGPLFHFTLRSPEKYTYLRMASVPDELVSHAGAIGGGVAVEFARPLGTGQSAELTFEFRGPPLAPGSHRIAFPAFTPVGAAERVGVLGISPGPFWAAELQPGVGTTVAGWFDPVLPLVPTGAASAFRYAGGDPDGWANLAPAKPEFTVDAATRITHQLASATGTTTYTIRVLSGALSSVVVAEPIDWLGNRTWRVQGSGNAVASAVQLPVNVVSRVLLGVDVLPQRLWLIRFARPVTDEVILETAATGVYIRNPGGPHPEATAAFSQVVVLGASQYRVVSAPDAKPTDAIRPNPSWEFAGLYLVTAVRSQSDVVAVFGGTVTSAGGTVLPITLPAGAEVRAANIGGRWLEPGAWRANGGAAVQLPMGTGEPVRFEVRYRLPVESGRVTSRVQSPEPTLPAGEGEVRRWWAFAPGVLPGWPVRAWERGTAADLPELLGDPLGSAAGVVVSRSPVEEVRVASTRTAGAIGIGVAALLFTLGWIGSRRQHPFCGLLVVIGLLAVGAVSLLGPPWWQTAAVIPLVIGLVAAAGMVLVRGHQSRLPAAIAATVLIGVMMNPDTSAQSTTPATVVILPANADGQETVVAPKGVLDRLAARPASPGVIVTAADYGATADDTTAHVTAKFVVQALDEAEAIATLPLTDAKLERVTVDGTAAFPAAPRPGVYTVPLPGKGRHDIEVKFSVPVTGTGTERDFRFGVPECPSAKVTADLPGSAKQTQVVGRVGQQTVTPGKRVKVETEAGAVRAVQVRWRDSAGGVAAVVKVREGCVWEVTEAGPELTACYVVRVEQGAISLLRFEVPTELDPLGVMVQGLGDPLRPTEPVPLVALRDWTLGAEQNGFRQLRLDFQGPTSGRVLVTLILNPRKAATRQPVLRFPKVILPGGATPEPDAAYGLRAKGVVIEELARGSGVIDFSPDALTRDRDFASTDLNRDPNIPVRVFRPVTSTPELRPTLRPAVEVPGVTLSTSWQLGSHRADANGTVRWSGKDAVALIEFHLAAKVTEVRGADVSAWSQSGGRVQVWLKKAVKEGEFVWSATVTPPSLPFEAGSPRVDDAKLVTETVRIRPAPGFSLTVERDRGWTRTDTAGEVIAYQTSNPTTPPVRVQLTAASPTARPDELGWLSVKPKPSTTLAPNATPTASPAVAPPVPTPAELPASAQWVWPVSLAVAWCAAILALGLLLARFPSSTWPEQFALVVGLFGAAVGGGWWLGLVAWALARIVWLVELGFRQPPPIRAG